MSTNVTGAGSDNNDNAHLLWPASVHRAPGTPPRCTVHSPQPNQVRAVVVTETDRARSWDAHQSRPEGTETMKDLLFLAADLWLMAVTWYFGIRMLRTFGNHLLTLEYLVVAVSSTNFLFWALLGGDESSPMYNLAYALDAFSRSFGFTLILVIGLMTVTHRWKPPLRLEIGVTLLAAVSGVVLGRLHNDQLQYDALHLSVAVFYVVTNVLTTVFLAYFAHRLWKAGKTRIAALTGLVTAAGTFVALTYDFFPFSFDDANRTIFYTVALTVWGCQGAVYYYAYSALHAHNAVTVPTQSREMEARA